jgi:hypothetical protein
MCGDPDPTMIGNNYNIVIRPQCNSAEPCDGNVTFLHPITFTNIHTINISTAAYYSESPIYATVCPLFTIIGATHITLKNLNITCLSTSDTTTAPAILITKSGSLAMDIQDVTATQWVQSTVIIDGGNSDLIPPLLITKISGFLQRVSASHSYYADPQGVTATNFEGSLNVSGLENYTAVTVLPGIGGNLTLGTNNRLDISDVGNMLGIYGTPTVTEFVTGDDLFGYTQADVDELADAWAEWLGYFFAGQCILSVILFQNLTAKLNRRKLATFEGAAAEEDF